VSQEGVTDLILGRGKVSLGCSGGQGYTAPLQQSLEGAAGRPDRHRAGRAQPRSVDLERHFPFEGSVGGDGQ
jgi:hypothetical protein